MIKIRKIAGRDLIFINGYSRVQIEMDKLLYEDIEFSYDCYKPPKNIIDHFIKRLIWYPRMLRKTEEKNTINHIIVQHLSDLARKLNPDRTIIHLLDIWNFLKHSGIRNSYLINILRLKGLENCKHIIAISEFTKQEAVEKLGIEEDKITVIRCGVNRKVFRPIKTCNIMERIDPYIFRADGTRTEFLAFIYNLYRDDYNDKKLKLLHIGTEDGRKEFMILLCALREITKYINVVLYRVGKPEYMKEIKKMELESNIKYISEISDVELNVLYNSVDLFICPSSYEGYGLSIMESLSAGTPVICSDIPVFKEIYLDCVTYFPVNNYIELSKKILRFWNNIDHIPVSKGIFLAGNNTWEKFTKQYYNYIKERFT